MPHSAPRAKGSLVLLVFLVLTSCGGDESSNPTQNNDVGTDATLDAGSDSAMEDSGTEDMASDLPINEDTGSDADDADADDADGVTSVYPTLADYFPCMDDVDCPVGLGDCVKTVSLNRPDTDGTTTVPIQTLFEGLAPGSGVCSRDCTLDETACDTLSLRDSDGSPVGFTCQVVTVGESPYPGPQAFPFDSQVNPTAMAAGPSFGAMCRPPFGLNNAHIVDFCNDCDTTQGCEGTGVCWRFETNRPVENDESGSCLEPVPGTGCPGGFESRTLSDANGELGDFCVPIAETCGGCQDRDEDGRGAGHCDNPQTDCDDRNPFAYYDSTDMAHPFPAYCGDHDYNCNGLSDEAEQTGVEAYKEFHCETCYDDADGMTVLAGTPAQATLRCYNGSIIVDTCADAARVSCSGAARTDGCESTADVGGATYYVDADGDGYGDPGQPRVGCPSGPAPGDVDNNTDCNDSDPAINPGALDLCECWGNCADPGARVDNNCSGVFDDDVTRYAWYPDADGDGAADRSAPNATTLYCGPPAPGMVIGSPTGPQADCDDSPGNDDVWGAGRTLILDGPVGMVYPSSALVAPMRDPVTHELYLLTGTPAAPEVCDRKDNNCNGSVDEGVFTTYYRDADGDGFGDPDVTTQNCAVPIALPPGNWVTVAGDCNDDPIVGAAAYPCDANGMNCPLEICDGLDNDCNGNVDGENNDVVVGTGDNCLVTTGNPVGACRFGTQTACSAGAWTCTPRAPLTFEDPNVPSIVTVSATNMTVLGNTDGDDDCDGPEVVVYVDGGSAGNDTNPGTSNFPFKTIAKALQNPSATEIRVAGGTYNLDRQLINDGPFEIELGPANAVDIVGGWNNPGPNNPWTWSNGVTEILRLDDLNPDDLAGKRTMAISALNVPAGTTLAYLDIVVQGLGTIPVGRSGFDHYGIHAVNSPLVLHEVGITSPNALDGASDAATGALNGERGHDGIATGPFSGSFMGDGKLACNVNGPFAQQIVDGGVGSSVYTTPGGTGLGAGGGVGGVWWTGYNANDWFTWNHFGKTGKVQSRGTCGDNVSPAAFDSPLIVGDFWNAHAGQLATRRGCNGSGGGGGGTVVNGRQGGGGGSGGCGGDRGISGGSGGSSFGIFAVLSDIKFTHNVEVKSGWGGHGGAGQSGGHGGDGGDGAWCYYSDDNDYLGCVRGGQGSPGNGGFGGAGGNGGSTFPVFSRGVDICNQTANLSVEFRTNPAGDGGDGGRGGRGGRGSVDVVYDVLTGAIRSGSNGGDAGFDGAAGAVGATRNCYVSTPCATGQCPTSAEECRADGWCYPLTREQPGLQTGYEVLNQTLSPTCVPIIFPKPFGVFDSEVRVVVNSDQGYALNGGAGESMLAWAEDVTEVGFELCVSEYSSADGAHREQHVAWIAFTDEGAKEAGLAGGRAPFPNSVTGDHTTCDDLDLTGAGFTTNPVVLFSAVYPTQSARPRTYAWGEGRTPTLARYCARTKGTPYPVNLRVDWLAFEANNPPTGFRGGRVNLQASGATFFATWASNPICANVDVNAGCGASAACELGLMITSVSDERGLTSCTFAREDYAAQPSLTSPCVNDSYLSSWAGSLNPDGTVLMCAATDGGDRGGTATTINWIAPLRYNAKIVANPIPKTMQCGQTYTPLLTVRNTGFIDWTEASAFRLGVVTPGAGWSQASGTDFPGAMHRLRLPPATTVQRGQEYSFPMTMVAPAMPGIYTVEYRMVRDGFTWFGESVISEVNVVCP